MRVSNSPYVISDQLLGRFYAKCIPFENFGSKGITKIYKAGKEEDELINTYDWYNSGRLILGWSSKPDEVAVMRLRQDVEYIKGRDIDKQIEFSFYIGGKFLKSYSTKDLVEFGGEKGDFIARSTDGTKGADYEVLGFEWKGNNSFFTIRVPNGNKIRFDINTGEVYTKPLPVKTSYPYNKEGKKIGEWKWWDEEGYLIASGSYADGQPWEGTFFIDGEIKVYKNGKLIKVTSEYKKIQPLQLMIKSEKETYDAGDDIKIHAEIKNISDKEIKLNDYFELHGTNFIFKNANGEECQIDIAGFYYTPLPPKFYPNESIKVQTFNINLEEYKKLALGFRMKTGNDYKVVGKHTIYMNSGNLTSNTITVEVVEKKQK